MENPSPKHAKARSALSLGASIPSGSKVWSIRYRAEIAAAAADISMTNTPTEARPVLSEQ